MNKQKWFYRLQNHAKDRLHQALGTNEIQCKEQIINNDQVIECWQNRAGECIWVMMYKGGNINYSKEYLREQI